MRRPPIRFRHLRTRLAVLYTSLFAVALIGVAVVAQVLIRRHAEEAVQAELATNSVVYDRIWALRARSLTQSADVLARDFGFRSAVATGDRPTIESALASLRARAGVAAALVVDQDGKVVDAGGDLGPSAAALPFTLPAGRRDAVVVTETGIFRLVLAPILAPTEIGWVVFGIRLDGTEMRALERLSAIPLTASIVRRDANGHWRARGLPQSTALDMLMTDSARDPRTLRTLALPTGDALAIAKPLAGAQGEPQAALLLRFPLKAALAPFVPLQLGIGLAGLLGMALVVLGSRRLAAGIARPIAALDAAAKALEEGARSEVAVEGDDEIGRLAARFNTMSAGIVEREHRITHLAFHDSLTGLPNRVLFRQSLEQAVALAVRSGENVAVLCLDLDGFKAVNDTLGHPVGDALLCSVGALLATLAADGTVSRLGGDEFAIVVAGRYDPDRPRALAQSIVDALRRPVEAAGHRIATDVSIGIAIGPTDGQDADQLLKNADLALHRAKQDGRGVFRFFEMALDIAARQRRQLELDLREALRTGQFRLAYQPIFHLEADRVGGFEALLRWEHPTRGDVPPLEFISVAEDTGLIVPLGEWVLHEACRQAMEWPDHVRIAVNVSPLQFRAPGFGAVVMQAIARSGLSPQRLEIEITESVFLDGEAPVVALLHQLRAIGVRVALDDFGTGYSSLSYLRSFPFDKIKIDRSFVTSVAVDAGAAAIVRAIVDLATALHMETTAEGVEDVRQLGCLRGQGCSSIQGYLFSRAVESDQVGGLLSRPIAQAA